MSVALLRSARPGWQRLDEQLRESRVIKIAGRTIAIWQNPFRVLRAERIVNLPLKRHILRNFNRETGNRRRVHQLGSSRLIANSTSTNAHKSDIVIMTPPYRPHSRLSATASAQGASATFEVRVRKVFLVRVAAIRRRASSSETEQIPLGIAESCDAPLH